MMTGSQTANVAAVGILTIPLMIKVGYTPIMAGAIEALASTGGMLVPPVMGSAAFIIPDMIGGTYLDVMRSAVIPGLLYYTAVFMFIQVQAGKLGLQRIPKEELKSMLGDPNLVIIDVRLPSHWDEDKLKIVGAVREEIRPVKYWMDKYPKEKTLVFYCA